MEEEIRTTNPKIIADLIECIRNLKNVYFKGKQLLPNLLAGDIVFDKFNPTDFSGVNRGFITLDNDKKDIYIYYDGCYHFEGKEVIETVARMIMGDKAKNQNVTEVVTAVKQMMAINKKVKDIENNFLHYVCMRNGILDLRTKQLLSFSKDFILFQKMPYDYNPNAKCPVFMKYINDVLAPDDVKVIQELLGYLLWKSYDFAAFFLFIGSGRNGKTTLLNLMRAFLGEKNVSSVSLHTLTSDPFAVAWLFGKLANISGDIGASTIRNTHILKILTGNDAIQARRIYSDFITFTNYAKIIFACNDPPDFPEDKSVAFSERLKFIQFNNYFPAGDPKTDPNILKKMTTEEELSGILNWALDGLERLLKNGKFSYNKATEDNLRLYEEQANPVLGFTNKFLEVKSDCYIPKIDVLAEWEKYCKENKKNALGEVHFNRKLYETLNSVYSVRIKVADGSRIHVYKNLAWKVKDKKTYSYEDLMYLDESCKMSGQKKLNDVVVCNKGCNVSIDDKLESLKICLEDNPLTYEELVDEGFSADFIDECVNRNIIIKRPDNRYVLNG